MIFCTKGRPNLIPYFCSGNAHVPVCQILTTGSGSSPDKKKPHFAADHHYITEIVNCRRIISCKAIFEFLKTYITELVGAVLTKKPHFAADHHYITEIVNCRRIISCKAIFEFLKTYITELVLELIL